MAAANTAMTLPHRLGHAKGPAEAASSGLLGLEQTCARRHTQSVGYRLTTGWHLHTHAHAHTSTLQMLSMRCARVTVCDRNPPKKDKSDSMPPKRGTAALLPAST